jgi:hypothetical protein
MSMSASGGDTDFMTGSGKIAKRDVRVLRATLTGLALLAQLMLPGVILRAEALAGELCVTSSGDGGQSSSKSHVHDRQCAHCRLHDCSTLAPPSERAGRCGQTAFGPAATRQAPALRSPLACVHPPPTGPPAG